MARDRFSGFDVHDRTPQVGRRIEQVGSDRARKEVFDAHFGRGPLAGKSGNPFSDDPFFNPFAPGGTFNKDETIGPRAPFNRGSFGRDGSDFD